MRHHPEAQARHEQALALHARARAIYRRNLPEDHPAVIATTLHLAEDQLSKIYTIREITRQTIPEDFRNERIHRAWRLVART